MQRTWWPEAGIIIVTGPYFIHISFSTAVPQYYGNCISASKANSQNVAEYIDGLMQERHNSTANALELHLPCTNHALNHGYTAFRFGVYVCVCMCVFVFTDIAF